MKHLLAPTDYHPTGIQLSEHAIHMASHGHLVTRGVQDMLWLHPANGEARKPVTGARLKAMGVLPGAGDILLWHGGKSFALELKRKGGRLSAEQELFGIRFEAAGGTWAVAYGLDEALDILTQWGLIK